MPSPVLPLCAYLLAAAALAANASLESTTGAYVDVLMGSTNGEEREDGVEEEKQKE